MKSAFNNTLTIFIFFILFYSFSPIFAQWQKNIIDNDINLAISVDVADLVGDDKLDLVVTNYNGRKLLLYQNNFPQWIKDTIDNVGATFAYCGDMDGDDTLDIVASLYNSRDLVWYENNHPTWTKHIIDANTEDGDFLCIGDLDNDDTIDVVTAGSYSTGGDLAWYENNSPTWTRHIIESGSDTYPALDLNDIDGDGLLDVVATKSKTNEVVWFRNEDKGVSWSKYPIDNNLAKAWGMNSYDINGDGKIDVVATGWDANVVVWYENNHPTWTKHVIDPNLLTANWVDVADVNGDDKIDVIASGIYANDVVWYENNHPEWNKNIIDSNIGAPRVFAITDIDGDKANDLLVPAQSSVVWYKNPHNTQINEFPIIIPDFQVNENVDESEQLYSFISVDTMNNFVITWADNRNDSYDIYAQRYSSNGTALGSNFKVNDITRAGWMGRPPFHMPSISSDCSGNFAITWECNFNTYAQRYLSDGTALGSNFKVNGEELSYCPSIGMDDSGNFVITWCDLRNNDGDIYAQLYSRDGTALGSNFIVNDDSESAAQSSPFISINGNGNFIITWEDYRNGGSDIYAQRYSSNGAALGSNFKVNDDYGYAIHCFPAVSTDDDENFVITWTDGRTNEDIYAQRYLSDGTALGSNFKVNGEEINAGNWPPSISMDGKGNFVITWTDNREGYLNIYAQRYDSEGNQIENNFRVTNTGYHPDVKLWNGHIYNTWVDKRGNDTSNNIWANVLDWDNPVGVKDKENFEIPSRFALSQNYPNPLNPSTTIKYSIPKQNNVTVKVFDVLGREVEILINKEQPQGNYEVEFDGTELTSGIYFYRLQAGDFVETRKMILLK